MLTIYLTFIKLCQHIYLTKTMSNKIGRPKVLKRDAKAVLIGARLSPQEAKEADSAITYSSQDKSKWLRDAIKEKIERQKTAEFISSLCENLKQDEWPDPFKATLSADGLPSSIGEFSLDSKRAGQGHFRPTDGNSLDKYPLHGANLKVSERSERLLVTHIQRCGTASPPAYHIWFDAL
jgi:hypothetical protein